MGAMVSPESIGTSFLQCVAQLETRAPRLELNHPARLSFSEVGDGKPESFRAFV
jgi:hypothetical protein